MKYILSLVTVTIFFFSLQAQDSFSTTNSKVEMNGTSTLHDWKANITKSSGSGKFTINNGSLTAIHSLDLTMEASTIKSEKGSGMDNNIYKALKTKQHPNITFSLTKVNSLVKKGNSYDIDAVGKLTVAGTTKTVNLKATGQESGGNIVVKGSTMLKMTDFNVEPPVLFLGTMKTGDDVTINFETTLSKSTGLSNK